MCLKMLQNNTITQIKYFFFIFARFTRQTFSANCERMQFQYRNVNKKALDTNGQVRNLQPF